MSPEGGKLVVQLAVAQPSHFARFWDETRDFAHPYALGPLRDGVDVHSRMLHRITLVEPLSFTSALQDRVFQAALRLRCKITYSKAAA